MEYAITTRIDLPFEQAVAAIRQALQAQGFGVLTEIDIQSTLADKLGESMERYLILGACNPGLAQRALAVSRDVGLLLPCNVVVREEGERTVVQALNPQIIESLSAEPALAAVADEATEKIRAALDGVSRP